MADGSTEKWRNRIVHKVITNNTGNMQLPTPCPIQICECDNTNVLHGEKFSPQHEQNAVQSIIKNYVQTRYNVSDKLLISYIVR